ncbi:MAG: BamA/TamA family outer membrane protein [Gemmatimonadetes bacterium]|nr:BamA/TamA family outer membrane protein [Gemmatimonadota bacterium]
MRRTAILAALGCLAPAAAGAQQTLPAGARAADGAACLTGPISFIFIDNHSIFDTSDPALDRRFSWAYRLANSLHVRTRPSLIRRELLFTLGDCYDPALLDESERLLRGYGFLSHVDVYGVRQPDGSYHVLVDTQDEWSTRLDLRVRLSGGLDFEGFRLREGNLLGTGRAVGLFYREREVTRDYGMLYETPQLAGTRWDLRASGGRTRAGTFANQALAYPFVGEVGHWAGRQSFRREDRFFDYVDSSRGRERHVLAPVRDKAVDVAALTRFGRRGNLTLLGLGLSFQELTYPGPVELVRDDDFDDRVVADSALAARVQRQMEELHNLRAFLLLGQRNIWWVKRRGLDALQGQQDVRLGAEVELALGRALPGLERDDDLFSTLVIYTGLESGRSLVTGRLRLDGRRDLDAAPPSPEWEDVLAEAGLLGYWQPESLPRHTLVLLARGAGGWHTRAPFQLTLGGDLGVRGYGNERFPGGRRALFTLEDRVYIGWPLRDVLDLGTTVFLDLGRVWPGDAPFGRDSGWRSAAGFGLRGSFPAGGRTTYRIDFAVPLNGESGDGPRLLFSIGELLGLTGVFGTPQMLRSRQSSLSGDLFHFPN